MSAADLESVDSLSKAFRGANLFETSPLPGMAAEVMAISQSKMSKVMGLQIRTAYCVDLDLKTEADLGKGQQEKPLRWGELHIIVGDVHNQNVMLTAQCLGL